MNGRPDLIIQKGDVVAAVEIETGKSDHMSNVQKNLSRGFPMIVIVATSPSAERAIQTHLNALNLAQDSRIRLISAKAF